MGCIISGYNDNLRYQDLRTNMLILAESYFLPASSVTESHNLFIDMCSIPVLHPCSVPVCAPICVSRNGRTQRHAATYGRTFMNLRDLEYVEAVGRLMNFSRAASACNVSQPALSNQIKKLEQELGAKLFDRRIQDIRPTELGRRVIESAQTILGETRKIHDMATEYRDPTAIPLRIGMTPTLAPYLMHYLFSQIRTLLPDIKVTMAEETADELIALVENRDIDIALIPRSGCETRLDFTPLFNEPLFLAVPKGHRLAGLEDVDCKDIPAGQLICTRAPLGFEAEGDLRDCSPDVGKDVALDVTATNFETACRYVCTNNGCTIVPALAAEQFKQDGWGLSFIRLRKADHVRNIGVVSRLGCPRKPLLTALCKQIYASPPRGVEAVTPLQRATATGCYGSA